MASAAAVGADGARSPLHNDDLSAPGVVSAIGSREDGIPETNEVEEDMDEVIRGTNRRKGPGGAAGVGGQNEHHELDGGGRGGGDDLDLFGDEEDEGADKPANRQLDDEELDSGDDVDRTDRVADEPQTQEQEYETQEKVTMELEMARQPVPEPSDGELYLLKVPEFMAIEPQAWSHNNFQPPTTDHHSNKAPSAAFSAYNTATSTIRWRHSPSEPSKLQSNTRILRWSDGSLTLQMGSQPTVQYDIDGNSLAPPQRNPIKPTPVSVQAHSSKGGRQGDGTILGEKYDISKDAYTYLVTPSEATATLRVTHKVTVGLSMKQPDSVEDEAIERLQAALAKAANASKVNGVGSGPAALELVEEDPEKKRIQAEQAMKDKQRRDRKAEAAIERQADKVSRGMNRSGAGRYSGGGLNASMLEDEDGMGTTRGRRTGATPKKSRRRRNSIYSDDEDFGRKRFATKEDEYDEEDDFLAPSDEEEVVDDEEEEEDPDDGIVDAPRRERTPKRDREPAAAALGDDADAEGEVDEDVQQARTKRRRVVDEDEDEE